MGWLPTTLHERPTSSDPYPLPPTLTLRLRGCASFPRRLVT